jgi:hypothetical protein
LSGWEPELEGAVSKPGDLHTGILAWSGMRGDAAFDFLERL